MGEGPPGTLRERVASCLTEWLQAARSLRQELETGRSDEGRIRRLLSLREDLKQHLVQLLADPAAAAVVEDPAIRRLVQLAQDADQECLKAAERLRDSALSELRAVRERRQSCKGYRRALGDASGGLPGLLDARV